MSRPRPRGLVILSTYLVQGLAAGFALTALVNHYAALGLSTAEVGRHFALVGLPWAAQPVLWGPLVDRAPDFAMGRRRALALAALLGALLMLGALLLVPDHRAVGVVGAVFLGHSVFASLLDTALDRMVIDHAPADALGRASALSRAGMVVGSAVGASGFGFLLEAVGFRASVAALLVASGLAGLPLLLVRERAGDAFLSLRRRELTAGAPVPLRTYFRGLASGLARPEALALLAFCFATELATTAFDLRLGVTLVQGGGWDAAALSHLQGALALASGTVGAALIGGWSDRTGAAPALLRLLGLCALAYALSAALIAWTPNAGAFVLGVSNTVPALLYVALVPAVMRVSAGSTAGTQFALYMAAMNAGDVAGAAMSGALGDLVAPASSALLAAATFALGAAALKGGWLRLH